jgi:transcriptional regulator with XRE-family HTH domain
MANRERLLAIGTRRGERLCVEYGEVVRDARIGRGLTQSELGAIVDVSGAKVSRIERAVGPHPDFIEAARIAQVLGLDLSVRCFPTGAPVRDAGHVDLIAKLCDTTPLVRWSLEEVIPIPGDLRAWDAVGRVDGVSIGVAAETRLRDVQALLRRENAKLRDSGLDLLILLILGSHANRETLRSVRESLRPQLPLDSRQILAALRQGHSPGANGIVIL